MIMIIHKKPVFRAYIYIYIYIYIRLKTICLGNYARGWRFFAVPSSLGNAMVLLLTFKVISLAPGQAHDCPARAVPVNTDTENKRLPMWKFITTTYGAISDDKVLKLTICCFEWKNTVNASCMRSYNEVNIYIYIATTTESTAQPFVYHMWYTLCIYT